jgi:hypothetical protein
MIVDYDRVTHVLSVRWGASPYKESKDCGEYLLEFGENDSIIGIEILEIYL